MEEGVGSLGEKYDGKLFYRNRITCHVVHSVRPVAGPKWATGNAATGGWWRTITAAPGSKSIGWGGSHSADVHLPSAVRNLY